jgi:hypothetical protein
MPARRFALPEQFHHRPGVPLPTQNRMGAVLTDLKWGHKIGSGLSNSHFSRKWGRPLGQGVNSGVFLRGEDSENPHPPMKGSSSFGRTSNRAFSGFDLDREVRSVTHLDLTVSCFLEISPSRAWQDQKAVLDFRRSIHSV